MTCKDGLVVESIARVGHTLARDIGRQWHLALARDSGIEPRAREFKFQLDLARLAARQNERAPSIWPR